MASTFKGDATQNQLGFFFQYFIALECCLNGEDGETVYIEQRGDVATNDRVYEVKHHSATSHLLSDRHIDFWKTLNNWVKDRVLFKTYEYLILITTSQIADDAHLAQWNSSNEFQKFELLQAICKEKEIDSIQPFVKNIFDFTPNYSKNDLLDILARFRIQYGQDRIDEKFRELEKHHAFKCIHPDKRTNFILDLIGNKIIKPAIKDAKHWKISISEFNKYLISQAKYYYIDDNIPLPTLYKRESVDDINPYQSRRFVQELLKIDYEKQIIDAINNYHRANQTITLLLGVNNNLNVSFVNAIEDYQGNLLRSLEYTKELKAIACQSHDIKERQKQSKICYIECMQWPPKPIEGISRNEDFFQRGVIHQIVEDGSYTWLIEDESSNTE